MTLWLLSCTRECLEANLLRLQRCNSLLEAKIRWGSSSGCWRRLGNWTTRRMFCRSRLCGNEFQGNKGGMSPKKKPAGLVSYPFQTTEVCIFIIYHICWRFTNSTFCEFIVIWWFFDVVALLLVFEGSFGKHPRFFWIARNGDPDGIFPLLGALSWGCVIRCKKSMSYR